jgi:hypothetical protein
LADLRSTLESTPIKAADTESAISNASQRSALPRLIVRRDMT